MPVLIEAISVVIRRKAINDKYPGGYLAFEQDAPMIGLGRHALRRRRSRPHRVYVALRCEDVLRPARAR